MGVQNSFFSTSTRLLPCRFACLNFKKIQPVCVILFVLVLTGCGFSPRGTTYQIPKELHVLELFSGDPNGPLNRALRNELRLNNIELISTDKNIVEKKNDNPQFKYPRFGVVSSSETSDTASIFMNGKSAEYQLTLVVNAHLNIPDYGIFPMTVRVHRSFFDNPLAAMQKDSEQNIIKQEMRQQAAQELVRRLSAFRLESLSQAKE